MGSWRRLAGLAAVAMLAVGVARADASTPPVLVKDINPGALGGMNDTITPAARLAYFVAFDPAHGRELWASDGTESGTRLVKDIRNGPGSGLSKFSSVLTVAGHTLYFIATTPRQGRELWASTGTSGTTRLVFDIAPGKAGSDPAALTAFKGRLAFDADDGIHGRELWITDGRRRGTRLVSDIRPGSGGGLRASNVASLGGDLYFQANDGTSGAELWRSDGTPAGTSQVADINAGPRSSYPGPFGVLGPVLLFSADDGIHGIELWRLTT